MEATMHAAVRFIGQAYTEANADDNDSYQSAWLDWESANRFAKLDELAGAAAPTERCSMMVFSPYGNIVYWIGRTYPQGTPVPKGYQSFDLPAATAATVTKKSSMMMTAYPVNTALQQGAMALDKAGYALPEYIGQTATPYYLESYELNGKQVAKVTYTVYVGADRDFGYDDPD